MGMIAQKGVIVMEIVKRLKMSKLSIIRLSDHKVFEVFKYIYSENEHHIWCNKWYGHHKIRLDCEWN